MNVVGGQLGFTFGGAHQDWKRPANPDWHTSSKAKKAQELQAETRKLEQLNLQLDREPPSRPGRVNKADLNTMLTNIEVYR